MSSGCLDAADGVLQVVERAAAARTGDVLRLRELDAGGLENGVCEGCEVFRFFKDLSGIGDFEDKLGGLAVDEQGAYGHGSLQLQVVPRVSIEAERDGVVVDAGLSLSTQPSALGDELHQSAGHGNLTFRFLRERHADGVADALSEQGTDAHGRLDASVLALAGFGHAEVERVVHVLLVHCLNEQAY